MRLNNNYLLKHLLRKLRQMEQQGKQELEDYLLQRLVQLIKLHYLQEEVLNLPHQDQRLLELLLLKKRRRKKRRKLIQKNLLQQLLAEQLVKPVYSNQLQNQLQLKLLQSNQQQLKLVLLLFPNQVPSLEKQPQTLPNLKLLNLIGQFILNLVVAHSLKQLRKLKSLNVNKNMIL